MVGNSIREVILEATDLCLPKRTDRLCDPPSLLFNRYLGSLPRLSRPGSEVDLSPPSIAKIRNEWNNTSAPPSRRVQRQRKYYRTRKN